MHTHGNIFYFFVDVNVQTVLFAELTDLFSRVRFFYKAEPGVLRAENNIVKYGKTFDKFKVLMHHTDAQRSRIVGVVDFYNLSVF